MPQVPPRNIEILLETNYTEDVYKLDKLNLITSVALLRAEAELICGIFGELIHLSFIDSGNHNSFFKNSNNQLS